LLTCGAADDGAPDDCGTVDGDIRDGGVAAGGTAADGAGLGATRGAALSGEEAPLGPNTKTWPTEMRKSAPTLFHRAKSRKSRSWRQAML